MEPINLRETAAPDEKMPRKELITANQGWWQRVTGEPMKKREKIIGVVALVLFLFVFYVTLDANKYRATVRVVEGTGKVGVNPTTERLDFGDLSRGSSAVRRVDIANNTGVPFYVMIWRTGDTADLIKLDKNFFVLPARASEKIEFNMYMPASAPIGSIMNGRVYLFKIPGPWAR